MTAHSGHNLQQRPPFPQEPVAEIFNCEVISQYSTPESTKETMHNDEREIRRVHSLWINAVNAGDLDHLRSSVGDDVVFLAPNQAPLGREGFSSHYTAALQQLQVCCTSELEEVVVVGEIAYTRSRDELSVTPRSGGETAHFAGYRVTIYRKQQDGRWLLSRDIHTLSAAT